MPRGGKKSKTSTKAKKTQGAKPGKGGKKGSSGGASSKTKKSMTVADLKRELERMLSSLSGLNAYFAKFPDPPAARTGPGADIGIGQQAIGDMCAPATDGPGVGTLRVIGDQCAPADTQSQTGTDWYVFKKTLARMTVTVSTLIGMLNGMDSKKQI